MQAKNTAALALYGVGACGPRGFYGTIDAHLTLERCVSRFMAADEAIVYSFDIATMPSVLPAFASRKDVIVIEDSASWPLRNGAALSRAQGATPPTAVITHLPADSRVGLPCTARSNPS